MISSHQEEKKQQHAVKIFFPFPYTSFSLWNKAKLSADLSRKRVLSKVFPWPDSHSLIWTIAASGKKSSVEMFSDRDKADLKTVQCHSPGCLALASPAPASCGKSFCYCSLEGWLWPGLQTPLRFLSPSGTFSIWNSSVQWSPVSVLDLGSIMTWKPAATSSVCLESRHWDLNWALSTGWIILAFL